MEGDSESREMRLLKALLYIRSLSTEYHISAAALVVAVLKFPSSTSDASQPAGSVFCFGPSRSGSTQHSLVLSRTTPKSTAQALF